MSKVTDRIINQDSLRLYIHVVNAIQEEIKKSSYQELSRISLQRRLWFSVDLALVVLGVRTAYLVDVVNPVNALEVFSTLVERLRNKKITASTDFPFMHLIHVFHAPLGPSFLVNALLLKERHNKLNRAHRPDSTRNWPTFVSLDDSPKLALNAAPDIYRLVSSLIQTLDVTVLFPSHLSEKELIPLAAFLIEYPVAYVPISAGQENFLSGIPLDVYECVVVHPTDGTQNNGQPRRHSMLKFSCPCSLGLEYLQLLSPQTMQRRLKERFIERVEGFGLQLEVMHYAVTHDRVAL